MSGKDGYPPMVSADERSPMNSVWALFDEGLKFAIKQTGRLRAPDKESQFRHEIGFAAELAVSGYYDAPVNRTVYDAYEGDPGWDLQINRNGEKMRVEIKGVRTGELKLTVDEDQLEHADYFVLCHVSPSLDFVEIVGGINRNNLEVFGKQSPYDSTLSVPPAHLSIFEPKVILPDQIRTAQQT